MAREQALMKKGSIVSPGTWAFSYLRRAMSLVASISSEKVKKGIVRDSVIVLVMAFFIPVILTTLSCSVMPYRGAI